MERDDKELVRSRTSIVDVIGRYTSLKRSGNRYKALCPFHNERTPSFHVDPDRGLWHCYGSCSTGGDVFSFLMKAEGIGFREALERLADAAGIVLVPSGKSPEEARKQRDARTRILEANAVANRFFRASLQQNTDAMRYVRDRGIDSASIERFALGYAPDQWDALAGFLRREGIAADDATAAGLIQPGRVEGRWIDRFRGRIVFPIHDPQERVVAFGGRLMVNKDDAPKYLNSPETPVFSKSRTLFALPWARTAISASDQVLVVEGYMDALACHQAGFQNVVATLGTALTADHVSMLGRYTRNIVLSFDADSAGVRAALRAAELVGAAGDDYKLRILVLPDGDDPDSLLRRGETVRFRDLLANAASVAKFRLQELLNRSDTISENGRLELLASATALLAKIASPLEVDSLIRSLVQFHPLYATGGGRAETALREEVNRLRSMVSARPNEAPTNRAGSQTGSSYPERRPRPPAPPGRDLRGNMIRETNPASSFGTMSASRGVDAVARAENAILRAWLDPRNGFPGRDDYAQGNLSTLFSDPRHSLLASYLESLREQPFVLPEDPELLEAIARIRAGDDADEPVSTESVAECVRFLQQHRRKIDAKRIMEQGLGNPEALDTEQLVRWNQLLRERQSGS